MDKTTKIDPLNSFSIPFSTRSKENNNILKPAKTGVCFKIMQNIQKSLDKELV